MKYVTPENGVQIEGAETPPQGSQKGRWKVACINWNHDNAPHATTYWLAADGVARQIEYHSTWEVAMTRARALGARFALADAEISGWRAALAEVERRIVAQPSCGSTYPTPHHGCFVADSVGIVRTMLAELGIEADRG